MKKKLRAFCTNAILLFTIIFSSNAQNSNGVGKLDLHSFNDTTYTALHVRNRTWDSGSLRLNERNSNAVRSFARDFRNVSDVKWIKSEKGGFAAYFVDNDIQNWIVYNSRGACEAMIRYYYEEKLPHSVRHVVKSAYYDFSIFCVHEITVNGITVYTVTLMDKARDAIFWKIVQVIDGEMELIKEYRQMTKQHD